MAHFLLFTQIVSAKCDLERVNFPNAQLLILDYNNNCLLPMPHAAITVFNINQVSNGTQTLYFCQIYKCTHITYCNNNCHSLYLSVCVGSQYQVLEVS